MDSHGCFMDSFYVGMGLSGFRRAEKLPLEYTPDL
jgi:hypothetical protein